MQNFEKQGGIAFLLIYYSGKNILYYMRLQELLQYRERSLNGGRKSFRFDELDSEFFLTLSNGCFVPYLNAIQKDLDMREIVD